MKNKKIFIIIIICLIIMILGAILFVKNNNSNKKEPDTSDKINVSVPVVQKKIKIVDLDKNERPYAVMINNHRDSRPQSGLKDAYLVYEIMVEYGITRMMALYTMDANENKIGSIRSSRHNYLDYVLENDAIYVHWGGSTYAYNDIPKLKIDNIDGMTYPNKYFVTDKSLKRSLEHTRFSSTTLIKKGINDLGYRTTRNNDYLLNYVTDEVDLSQIENNKTANKISIKYSNSQTSSYEYNNEEKVYYRSMNNAKHIDLVTKEQYSFKNIIAYSVKYKTISSSGHQELSNVGNGTGYYITNGYAIPINWTKKDRASQTMYTYQNGEEINVSDGNTFIQIYPTSGKLSIS